jgi:hypothetical protein
MASSLHLLLSDRGKMLELRDGRHLWQPSNLPRLRPASFRDFLDDRNVGERRQSAANETEFERMCVAST